MNRTLFRLIVLVFALMTVAGPAVRAQDLGSVKARIAQRLSKLDSLKASGALGENNRGFVEVRGSAPDAASVASAENQDRGVVYAAIAKQTGSSADAVGRARARQIAAASASGVWLQREDNSWYKK
jgi:uncharacterized protein YdbL (DUF1318 family)